MQAHTPQRNAVTIPVVPTAHFCHTLLAHNSVSSPAYVKGSQVLSPSSTGTMNLRGVRGLVTHYLHLTLTDSPTALLHMKTAFYHPSALPFAVGGTEALPHLICREASEPSLLICTTGQWLTIWKARR